MFIGHFALGMAAKKTEPRLSLGAMFLAVQFLDLLWPTLLILGVERVELNTAPDAVIPLNFVHYPISHSLLMAVVWGAAVGGVYWFSKGVGRASVLLGLLLLSHWVLDLFVHIPDLPLYPGDSPLLGFGLWRYKIPVFIVESALFAGGVYLYLNATSPRNKVGTYAFWGLAGFMYLIHLANIFGPPPTDVSSLGWAAQFQWIFVLWAFWVDRNRAPVVAV